MHTITFGNSGPPKTTRYVWLLWDLHFEVRGVIGIFSTLESAQNILPNQEWNPVPGSDMSFCSKYNRYRITAEALDSLVKYRAV